jgi:hypothetical protein
MKLRKVTTPLLRLAYEDLTGWAIFRKEKLLVESQGNWPNTSAPRAD